VKFLLGLRIVNYPRAAQLTRASREVPELSCARISTPARHSFPGLKRGAGRVAERRPDPPRPVVTGAGEDGHARRVDREPGIPPGRAAGQRPRPRPGPRRRGPLRPGRARGLRAYRRRCGHNGHPHAARLRRRDGGAHRPADRFAAAPEGRPPRSPHPNGRSDVSPANDVTAPNPPKRPNPFTERPGPRSTWPPGRQPGGGSPPPGSGFAAHADQAPELARVLGDVGRGIGAPERDVDQPGVD